jgi:hypothetical protein
MKNSKWLWLGIGLILFSVYTGGGMFIQPNNDLKYPKQTLEIKEPSEQLKSSVQPIIKCFKDGSNERSIDGYKLAELYRDMSILIISDNDILQTTEAIRQANILSAKILQIDIKGKYPGLADECDNLFKTYVSADAVSLDDNLRAKSSETFAALAWACLEGSK